MVEIGNSKYKITYENGILSEWYGDTLKSQRFLPMDEAENQEDETPEEEAEQEPQDEEFENKVD